MLMVRIVIRVVRLIIGLVRRIVNDFYPCLLENMIIFMIPDISILCVYMWRFGYDFQLENETQSTTDS